MVFSAGNSAVNQHQQLQGAAETLFQFAVDPGHRTLPAGVFAEQDLQQEGGQMALGTGRGLTGLCFALRCGLEGPVLGEGLGGLGVAEERIRLLQELHGAAESDIRVGAGIEQPTGQNAVFVAVDTDHGGLLLTLIYDLLQNITSFP